MREKHPVFDDQPPGETVIWRYYDLPKYLSMLDQEGLYFSRGDLLGDPLEGSFTRAREAERQRLLDNPPPGRTKDELQHVFAHNARYTALGPKSMYVNCWHASEHESMAMWRGYGGGAFGIAVRSTFGLLDEALPERIKNSFREESIFLGRVRYLDYMSEAERIPNEYNLYGPFLCKSLAYAHEKEVRAVFSDIPAGMGGSSAPGYVVKVNLARLITDVVISPLAPPWFADLVESMNRRMGFSFAFRTSVAGSAPIY